MAATIAYCTGYDKTRVKEDHRLGSQAAEGVAKTWHTTAIAYVNRDGSGYVIVKRDGNELHHFQFEAETES